MNKSLTRWFAPSHVSAGFIAVLVGYTSSAAIVFQAANAAGASAAEISSWLWALGIGMGLNCIGLSLYFRNPILVAWSTPGAALLAVGLVNVPMNEAIGAFIFSALLITITGATGWFERLMSFVPKTLAAAMLAGILLRFGLNIFTSFSGNELLIGSMCVSYLVTRRFMPRYAIPLTFLVGLFIAALQHTIKLEMVVLTFAQPVPIMPAFSMSTLIGVGLPLFIVTMASQNVPGLAVLRAHGYNTPASPLIGWTGLTNLLMAPFGGFSLNLAAITAAICMTKDADPDPSRRYLAAIWAGIFYLMTGIFGATVASLFSAFPNALVVSIAGLALLGTIGNSLAGALGDEKERESAIVTFLVTASGLTLFGIGSAFWGLIFGLATAWVIPRR